MYIEEGDHDREMALERFLDVLVKLKFIEGWNYTTDDIYEEYPLCCYDVDDKCGCGGVVEFEYVECDGYDYYVY